MATGNFHIGNSDTIFAVLMGYEAPILDDDGEETDEMEYVQPDEWEYEDFIGNFLLEAAKLEKDGISIFPECHTIRDAKSLGGFSISKVIGDIELQVSIYMHMFAGYYEGASLDWDIEISIENEESSLGLIEETYLFYSDLNKGLATIQARNAERWIADQQELLIAMVEKLFTEQSTPLEVTARFSNGETIYAKK